MSFLNRVRIAFEGTFQADVSTVNNDVRHYDNASFAPSFQEFQDASGDWNGWWNPTGSGAFRLLGCRVTGVWYADGSSTSDPAVDPIVGTLLGGSQTRTSGKLVDIDPQWQLASAIWGLEVRLCDGDSASWFSGRYAPNAFRDLWFSRNPSLGGDRAASATFQSVLDDVTWGGSADARSRAISELRARTSEGRLSIRIATFGYQDDVSKSGFTVGTVVGAIGPYASGEPTSFIRGRRFTPASMFSSWAGITWFSGQIDPSGPTLLLDLSNALQIQDSKGTPNDIGRLSVGILEDPSLRENTPVDESSFLELGEIPYKDAAWLQKTGGVYAVDLDKASAPLASGAPLALVVESAFNPGTVSSGASIVAIRESDGGLLLGAEPAVHRVDGAGSTRFTVWASRYGQPLPNAELRLALAGRSPGQGGGDPNDPKVNSIPIPDIGVPAEAVSFPPSASTGADGQVSVEIQTKAPGNPRGYIDGQLYLLDFRLPGQSYQARSAFDYVILHLRDDYPVIDAPTWDDVSPILTQYANLYPIMSQRLINLADPAAIKANARLLLLAFTRDIHDPNYMPVTRDLSEGKRLTIVRYLEGLLVQDDPALEAAIAAGPVKRTLTSRPRESAGPPPGAKTQFAQKLGFKLDKGGRS